MEKYRENSRCCYCFSADSLLQPAAAGGLCVISWLRPAMPSCCPLQPTARPPSSPPFHRFCFLIHKQIHTYRMNREIEDWPGWHVRFHCARWSLLYSFIKYILCLYTRAAHIPSHPPAAPPPNQSLHTYSRSPSLFSKFFFLLSMQRIFCVCVSFFFSLLLLTCDIIDPHF